MTDTEHDWGVKSEFPHQPVMLPQVLERLGLAHGHRVIDATYGDGHYARAFAGIGAEVFAFDKDPEAIEAGRIRQSEEKLSNLHLIDADFGAVHQEMRRRGIAEVDAMVFDLGVSSRQLDDGRRGFSFRRTGPLDMRMSKSGLTAYEIVNQWSLGALTQALRRGGESTHAKAAARAIAAARAKSEIADTKQLAEIIQAAIPQHLHPKHRHPATTVFQAIRIEVNQELTQLERALAGADELLKKGGRLLVVSFHSLEDKIVMRHLRRHQGGSRHLPEDSAAPRYRLLSKQALTPDEAECRANPRARSARLRAAEKC